MQEDNGAAICSFLGAIGIAMVAAMEFFLSLLLILIVMPIQVFLGSTVLATLILKSKMRRRGKYLPASTLMVACLELLWIPNQVRANYLLPTEQSFLQQMVAISKLGDSASILNDLKSKGLSPKIQTNLESVSHSSGEYGLRESIWDETRSAIQLSDIALRPGHPLFGNKRDVIYLFDGEGRLMVWASRDTTVYF